MHQPSAEPEPRNYRPGGYLKGGRGSARSLGRRRTSTSRPANEQPARLRPLDARRGRAARRHGRRRRHRELVGGRMALLSGPRAAAPVLHADRAARGDRDLRPDRGIALPNLAWRRSRRARDEAKRLATASSSPAARAHDRPAPPRGARPRRWPATGSSRRPGRRPGVDDPSRSTAAGAARFRSPPPRSRSRASCRSPARSGTTPGSPRVGVRGC